MMLKVACLAAFICTSACAYIGESSIGSCDGDVPMDWSFNYCIFPHSFVGTIHSTTVSPPVMEDVWGVQLPVTYIRYEIDVLKSLKGPSASRITVEDRVVDSKCSAHTGNSAFLINALDSVNGVYILPECEGWEACLYDDTRTKINNNDEESICSDGGLEFPPFKK